MFDLFYSYSSKTVLIIAMAKHRLYQKIIDFDLFMKVTEVKPCLGRIKNPNVADGKLVTHTHTHTGNQLFSLVAYNLT